MFTLSKLLGALTEPLVVVVLLLGLGWLLGGTRRFARTGRRLSGGVLAGVLLVSVVPFETVLTAWLENRFPPPAMLPERVDGIIVLGGAINPVVSAARGQITINRAAARLTETVPLAGRYPEARIIFTGGSGSLVGQDFKEAPYAKVFLEQIGTDTSRMIFEPNSRNTRENALLSQRIMQPRPDETWLLVTSAAHMARAVGCFRAVGWPVTAYPVDYVTTGRAGIGLGDLRFNPAAGLMGLGGVLHELVGLAAYAALGWSDAVFPAP